ncbi:MAG: ABC transporter ATP-binding protein [Bacteroidetes bacterium]|nr:MAG: ABC transporter ATP-binding protein [Bacteroidota bacterium]
MFRPKKEKKEKIKLSKESIRKARHIFSYLKKYRLIFSLGWVFLVLSTSAGMLFPLLMGKLLGAGGNTATDTGSLIQLISFDNINQVAIALFLLFGAQAVFSFFRVVIFNYVTENVLRDIRQDSFSKLVYMPMSFFNRNKVGELTSRMASDISQIQETMRTTIAEFFRQVVMIVGVIVILAILSWKLALIMLGTVPVMALIAVFFGRFIRKLSKKAQDETAKSTVIIEENLSGISNVKAFTNELRAIRSFTGAINEIRSLNLKSGLWRGFFASFIIICLFGVIVFIIWQGLLLTQGPNPELSLDNFYAFVLYTIMMGASVGSIPELYANIQKAIGSTENLMNLIETESEQDLDRGELKPEIKGAISFDQVSFAYPQRSDVTVLKEISLEAKPSQRIALVGPSGAGKSTIASLLLRFFEPNSGKILVDDTNQLEIDLKHLRSHMAYVPQEVLLFAGTIRENIAFGNPEASEEKIVEAARQANALDFIQAFPKSFDTEVGDRGIQLSGGQKQRIAIARALLKNPTILILDEATSALDAESEKLVQDALDRLMEGRTSIVIAHRLSTIRKSDCIYVLEGGQVIESGTHQELISIEEGAYANLVNLQLEQHD